MQMINSNLMKLLHLSLAIVILTPTVKASQVEVKQSSGGWTLSVDGQAYFVRGVVYQPIKIGEDPNAGTLRDWMIEDDDHDGRIDAPYQSWVDKNRNNKRDPAEPIVGDFRLLQEMGANTIRIYHHPSNAKELQTIYGDNESLKMQFAHPPNLALLRDLFKTYGIRVAIGDVLGAYTVGSGASWDAGTDYRDHKQCENMMTSVEDMVRQFQNEPFLLVYVLGNENNLEYAHTNAAAYPKVYAEFVNKVARRIHELDPHHPVVLCNGETMALKTYAQYAPEVDIFGVNAYRKPGFGTLWKEVSETYNKPILFTEFGPGKHKVKDGILDEASTAHDHYVAWCDIERHAAGRLSPQNAIGGFAFTWLDNWWEDGEPDQQNEGGNGWNHEYQGIASQGGGSDSPFLRQLRPTYAVYQKLWKTGELHCDKPSQ